MRNIQAHINNTRQSLPGGNFAIIMGAGKGTRELPLTWDMPKAMVPTVGLPILERINLELLRENGFTEQKITTLYHQDQIKAHIKDINKRKLGINFRYYSLGKYKENLIGNAGSVFYAYRKRFGNRDYINLSGLHNHALKKLSSWWLEHIVRGDKSTNADLFNAAVDEIRGSLKPLLQHNLPLFAVVGCDCLAKVNMVAAREHLLENIEDKGVVGNLILVPFWHTEVEDIQSYGLATIHDGLVSGFEEKPINIRAGYPSRQEWKNDIEERLYVDIPEIEGDIKRPGKAYLVNPQIYDFNPAVLAIIQTHLEVAKGEKHPDFPDMSMHVNKLLAAAGLLSYRIMHNVQSGGKEYWNDIGDLLTYRRAVTDDILANHDLLGFQIPGKVHHWEGGIRVYEGANAQVNLATAHITGHAYIGGSIGRNSVIKDSVIETGAIIDESSIIANSVILPGAHIYPGWTIVNSIVGPGVQLRDPLLYGMRVAEIENSVLAKYYNNNVLWAKIPGATGGDCNKKVECPQPLGLGFSRRQK